MRTLAVVGAGFCGTMVAAHVLRRGRGFDRVVLVERSGRAVGGVAYGTTSSSHTLNVPVGRMSAFEDRPDDFLDFLRAREPAITGGSFVPRRAYGAYLTSLLGEARRASPVRLFRLAGEAVSAHALDHAVVVALGDGRAVHADALVLAVGNYPPSDPPGAGVMLPRSIRYARDPWSPDALELDRTEPVLLVGTGLTMCDIVLALRDADHAGTIVGLSRRGLLPQAHRLSPTPPPHLEPPAALPDWSASALGFLRGLREEVRTASKTGIDWREVVTSIRHETPALWQRLDATERRRFLQHLRPYWETHRHRSSPETAFAVESLVEAGALQLVAGTIVGYRETPAGIAVSYLPRGTGDVQTLEVGKVINCTGPTTDLATVSDPLISQLRESGAIRPDELGLGLDTNTHGALVGADGTVSGQLFLLGPLRKGALWESTAVPELRVQAEELATRLVGLHQP